MLFLISISPFAFASDKGKGKGNANDNETFIFGEWKKTSGTIQYMEQGDRACYIDLIDDLGNEFSELAYFDLCYDTSFLGKKVQLVYEQGKVLAASCQGNMDCGESDTVILIHDVKLIE